MAEGAQEYERLQVALEIIESLLPGGDANCAILGASRDEAVIVGTADAYLVLSRVLLAFVLKVKRGIGPLEDLAREEFVGASDRPYCTCDVARAFSSSGFYRHLVSPVVAYMVDSEEERGRIEAFFEGIGE